MNPYNNELDQYLRTIGQVEPEPEPKRNEPENPGGEQVTDNEDPVAYFFY
jgi:hypothetical protein